MFRSGATFVLLALTRLTGCSSVPIPPTYTQDELKVICERQGGWWRPDDLIGGYCEYQEGGMPQTPQAPVYLRRAILPGS